MSLLPTAHAGQAFGSRRIDYFTVNGHVSESDAHIGQVVDNDGMDHEIKLLEQTSALAPGDTATVLRVQAGPNRRSRPVALVNHSRGVWMRASPDATAVLARSGVTRTLNWWFSLLFLAIIAAAAVWTDLHAFLSEVNAGLMAGVPIFDMYADLAQRMPALASWRLETALPTGLFDAIAGLGFIPMEQLTEWGLGIGSALLAIVAFSARSWRLIYIPAVAAAAVLIGGVFGGALPTLMVLGGTALLFVIGGLVNRIRDGGRFNARVDRLAEHVLRNPPQEGVAAQPANDTAPRGEALPAAAAAAAIASAAAAADQAEDTVEAAADATDAEAPATGSEIVADSASEAEATVAELNAAAETPSEPEAAVEDAETGAAEPVEDSIAAAPATTGTEEAAEPAAEAESVPEAELADAPDAAEASDAPDAEPIGEAAPETPAEDDDLPSLEAVAAAAALNDSEATETAAEAEEPVEIDLEDERTMPVAPPPPMPAASDAADSAGESGDIDAAPVAADTAEIDAFAPVDDPLIDDAADPMMADTTDGDFAPGAPDIEVDETPAQ